MIKNILTKRVFFKNSIIFIYMYDINTLSIDFYVKFINSKMNF